MKTRKSFFLLATVFIAASSFGLSVASNAAVHEGSDILGLATTTDETGEFFLQDSPLGPFDLHLLVYGFDHSQGIAGWECQVILPAGVQATGITLVGKADPAGVDLANCNIQVYPTLPIHPVNGIAHLATLHLELVDNAEDLEIFLAPYSSQASKDSMNFSLETSHSNMFEFSWPDDCPECSVFDLIHISQPVVKSTWDLVKSLYQ
ncbi:MAG: hypothetical protein KOO60_09720 [Gemmatimonadales bacterium]|nr:hypothetical protein [Gemmatimonadales bacterium]